MTCTRHARPVGHLTVCWARPVHSSWCTFPFWSSMSSTISSETFPCWRYCDLNSAVMYTVFVHVIFLMILCMMAAWTFPLFLLLWYSLIQMKPCVPCSVTVPFSLIPNSWLFLNHGYLWPHLPYYSFTLFTAVTLALNCSNFGAFLYI